MSIALVTPQQILTIDAAGGAQASATLIPELLGLLERAGCTLRELDAIAFGCGPGAFTGLRTACAVAQGLALGAERPVIAIDSLMLVAESLRGAPAGDAATFAGQRAETVWIAQDARMDEVYAAAYRPQPIADDGWQVVVAPALYSIAALNSLWRRQIGAAPRRSVLVAGSALSQMGERLDSADALRVEAAAAGGRALALARLAVGLWHRGALLDAAAALPLYLRDKVAQTTLERAADRAARTAA